MDTEQQRDGITTQVNRTKGDGPSDMPSKIDSILKRAERDIVDTLVTHYHQVSESTTATLGDIERDLSSRPERDEISRAADRSIRDEDDLRSYLKRTRRGKLSALHRIHHHHRPPVSSGTPAREPRRFRVTQTVQQGEPGTVPKKCPTGPPITCIHPFPVTIIHTITLVIFWSLMSLISLQHAPDPPPPGRSSALPPHPQEGTSSPYSFGCSWT